MAGRLLVGSHHLHHGDGDDCRQSQDQKDERSNSYAIVDLAHFISAEIRANPIRNVAIRVIRDQKDFITLTRPVPESPERRTLQRRAVHGDAQ